MHKHHRIGRQELSVREHMSRILKHLQSSAARCSPIVRPAEGRSALVVTFPGAAGTGARTPGRHRPERSRSRRFMRKLPHQPDQPEAV
jgi:hypothetical protein